MKYYSTRNAALRMSAAEAIQMGLSRDGGLLTPESFPTISQEELSALCEMDYAQRAAWVMGQFLEDFSHEELLQFARNAYNTEKYDTEHAAPLHMLDGSTACLELWHGPTSAFKDMALQMLPQLLSASLKKTGEEKTVCILVATSGDTGKAAMEGFADVPKTKIMVFYPKDGVSDVQRLQMVTQEGKNVGVCSVLGNFDDAQSGVKRIFSDAAMRKELEKNGYVLSSANSINWGRILPQVVYYVSAYCDLLRQKRIAQGERVNFCVPTGNFGNILAAYYAKKMGLPIGKLICASNSNDVLTEFLRTGRYDRNRPFHTTMSPSMDILISSNLERLLFDLSGQNDVQLRAYMEQLSGSGVYQVSEELLAQLKELFWAGCCDEAQTMQTITEYWQEKQYLIDPHTAVAAQVMGQYRRESGDKTMTVFVSTASPYKFCRPVLEAMGRTAQGSGIDLLDQLHEASGVAIPKRLAALRGKAVRFADVTQKQNMEQVVREFLR